MDRTSRLSPLGVQRIRVLECLGGSSPRSPSYFAPAADTDIFTAFRSYVEEESERWANVTDLLTTLLVAAGRLLTGDLAGADVILDHLPAEGVRLDLGAGICQRVPLHAVATTLPLPENLQDTRRWAEGSAEQAALRAWLAEYRDKLRWVESDGVYHYIP
jgi:hypothetical protein